MKKHIGFLIMNFENGGGTERVTSVIASELAKRNYKVTVISCQKGEKCWFDISSAVKLCSLHGEKIGNPIIRKAKSSQELGKIVKKEEIDIMIAVDVALYLYLWPLRKRKICKCIAWEHFNYYVARNKTVTFARKLAAEDADCVVVLGTKDMENYKANYRKCKQIEIIRNPLLTTVNGKSCLHQKRVLAVGRLTKEKGMDRLLYIWAKVERQMPDWRLDIYGEGNQKNLLQKQIHDLGLNNVRLCGYAGNVEEEYLKASVFALTSRYEGFGLVLIEAMAKGVPCISFDCKVGPSEIIDDGVNGYLIEDGNVEEFAEKLLRIMKDDELRKSFSEHTGDNLDRYNIESIMEQWESLLFHV